MKQSEIGILCEYFLNYTTRLRNEVIEMEHRLIFRKYDEVDYLELIILLTRIKECTSIEHDLFRILKLNTF